MAKAFLNVYLQHKLLFRATLVAISYTNIYKALKRIYIILLHFGPKTIYRTRIRRGGHCLNYNRKCRTPFKLNGDPGEVKPLRRDWKISCCKDLETVQHLLSCTLFLLAKNELPLERRTLVLCVHKFDGGVLQIWHAFSVPPRNNVSVFRIGVFRTVLNN